MWTEQKFAGVSVHLWISGAFVLRNNAPETQAGKYVVTEALPSDMAEVPAARDQLQIGQYMTQQDLH